MDQKMSFINNPNIFIGNETLLNSDFLMNKLFATFTTPAALEETVATINRKYSILFSKVFILESPQSDELICTYNIDTGNMSASPMANTILLHRKKESNTLYTINALNTLIKSLNGGRMDKNFMVNWQDYKNSILLTNGPDLRKLDTAIHRIVDFSR
jgi:dsDNA-specific endonuclease/ATPase MutS2